MRAYVGVGSNLGDRWAHLAQAARGLRSSTRVSVLRASRVWDTAPMGPAQPRYLNAVLELETGLPVDGLHQLLVLVEDGEGRERRVRWGPRTLDLDLLLFGDAEVELPGLAVPHPGLRQRRFVLQPLAELCPDCPVPGLGATAAELLGACPPHDMVDAGPYPLGG